MAKKPTPKREGKRKRKNTDKKKIIKTEHKQINNKPKTLYIVQRQRI